MEGVRIGFLEGWGEYKVEPSAIEALEYRKACLETEMTYPLGLYLIIEILHSLEIGGVPEKE
jgi:hypothetical protein